MNPRLKPITTASGSSGVLVDPRIVQGLAGREGSIPWRQKRGQRILKRLLDMGATALLILLLWPVMLLLAVLVRLTSRGPVLFVQTRIGLNGVPYRMAKFRSMIADLPDGSARGDGDAASDDPRLTSIGWWLRAWRLDELPQLFHVLTGSMSLVGPRAVVPAELDEFPPEHMLQFAMPPGCTAWTFTRGGFANDSAARQIIDVEYVERWSLWLDIKILARTPWVILAQENTTPEIGAGPPLV